MRAEDFLRSAGPMTEPGLARGERIRKAVIATEKAAGCNTDFDSVLLCAPLLQASLEHPEVGLAEGVRRLLGATKPADTEGSLPRFVSRRPPVSVGAAT